jgi:hypothetical protein
MAAIRAAWCRLLAMNTATPAPSQQAVPAPLGFASRRESLAVRSTAESGVNLVSLLSVLTVFWCYVAVSNVLYATNMQATLREPHVFAGWLPRMLQHLFLYPFLVACVWTSLRVGWQRLWLTVPIQLALALFFSILAKPALGLGEALASPDTPMKHEPMSGMIEALPGWLASATSFLLTYGFGLALITGLLWYQRYRDSQLRFTALERSLASTRLSALRMQLSPHTLFNLLHTIRGQIGWDPTSAQTMVVQLSDVLRRLLTAGERDFSRLSDEIEFVRLYLELQRSRFSDRLNIRMSDLGEISKLWVPSLILQPLVENAVTHGLAGHAGPVQINVEVCVDGQLLMLRVVNTIAPDAMAGPQGIGLRNVRERLSLHFGDAATLHAGATGSGTWISDIHMPLVLDARASERSTN